MRIRTVKPEWLTDERVLAAGSDARVLSIALILLADDYGNGRGNEAWLAAQVFPLDREPLAKVRGALARLTGWFCDRYEIRGQSYISIRNWEKHQRVDKPGKPHVPARENEIRETPENIPVSLAPDPDLRPMDLRPMDLDRVRSRGPRPKGWRRVPETWQPDENHRTLAASLAVDLGVELAKFRDHEFAKPKSDPSAAFRNWLRNAASGYGGRGGGTANQRKGPAIAKIGAEFDASGDDFAGKF